MFINGIVKGQPVEFTSGDFRGQGGVFNKITGYTDGYGCVCQIEVAGDKREFTSDFFKFVNPEVQEKWDDDSIDFKLE